MEETAATIRQLGLPTFLLLGVLVGLYRLGRLLIEKVCVPVAEAHVAYLHTSATHMETVAKVQEGLLARIDNVCHAKPTYVSPGDSPHA